MFRRQTTASNRKAQVQRQAKGFWQRRTVDYIRKFTRNINLANSLIFTMVWNFILD